MKENKLTIKINRPVSKVFGFTITPSNTSLWIDSIVKEQIEGDHIGVGTRYTNESKDGAINVYEVTEFQSDKVFQLKSMTTTYHVRYTYTSISENETELEYYEWIEAENRQLESPFERVTLEKLKSVLETN